MSMSSLRAWALCGGSLGMALALAPPCDGALLPGTQVIKPGNASFVGLVPPQTPPGTQVAAMMSPFAVVAPEGVTSGGLTTAVYRNGSGTLDFYYQIENDPGSQSAVIAESNANFSIVKDNLAVGIRTDTPTVGAPFVVGTVSPSEAQVSLPTPATTVGFQFGPGDIGKIAPGATSTIFVVSTGATGFGTGTASIQANGSQAVTAFEPAQIPEPGTIMVGVGLVGLVLFRRQRERT